MDERRLAESELEELDYRARQALDRSAYPRWTLRDASLVRRLVEERRELDRTRLAQLRAGAAIRADGSAD